MKSNPTPLIAASALIALLACGDSHEPTSSTTSSSAGNGGSGGSGSSGGSGGSGGATGATGGSGTGGSAPEGCMDSAVHEPYFSFKLDGLCVVAHYTAPYAQGYPNTPTWGRHGGPLTLEQAMNGGDTVTLHRFSPPDATSGALVKASSGLMALDVATSPLYINTNALDLIPGTPTVVGYDVFGKPDGEMLWLSDKGVEQRFDVNGLFAYATIPGPNNQTRLLYTAVSAVNLADDPPEPGLFAIDICELSTVCGYAALEIRGDASGPIVVDSAGNVIGVFPSLKTGTQEVLGFAVAEVGFKKLGGGGAVLAELEGSGLPLATLAPTTADHGIALFQTTNASFEAQDIIAIPYYNDSGELLSTGPVPAIDIVTDKAGADLFNDDQGRIWLGVGTNSDETTYFVIDRVANNN